MLFLLFFYPLDWFYSKKYDVDKSLAVPMCDLNGLKEVNDKQGHEYQKYRFLIEDKFLKGADQEFYDSVGMEMPEYIAAKSLQRLSCFLTAYYGKKVLIFLDEYDTPMQESYVNGFWGELAAFTRSLFNATFKTNPYLERAIMTGITRVSKESIFSDLNNLKVVTITSNEYETCFGFTEEEVFAALEECGYNDSREEVKQWYDGFTFGRQKDIYNPWSILNYLDTGKIGSYWANTSSNSLVGKMVREGDTDIKEMFETLLKGGHIRCPIDEQIVYNNLDDDPNAIWSLLLASGYLKATSIDEKVVGKSQIYELSITNAEALEMMHLF